MRLLVRLLKARRRNPRLVPVRKWVKDKRGGHMQTVYVTPAEAKQIREGKQEAPSSGAQLGMFDEPDAPVAPTEEQSEQPKKPKPAAKVEKKPAADAPSERPDTAAETPRDGQTKTVDGKTYELINGRWHRSDLDSNRDSGFIRWFNRFLEEKQLPYAQWEIEDAAGTTHIIDTEVVIEAIRHTSAKEQAQIKDMIVRIDVQNGDVNDYLKHLATGLVHGGEVPKIEAKKVAPDPRREFFTRHESLGDIGAKIADTEFTEYGAWQPKGKGLSAKKRMELNQDAAQMLTDVPPDDMGPDELAKLRRYSGFGGVKAADERGVIYDYYTSPPVAKMTWQLLNKLAPVSGNVLEPSCGTGVFLQTRPEDVSVQGVELDSRSGTVASILHPDQRVAVGSYEQFNLWNDEEYDHVIGNAPFGERSVETAFMDRPDITGPASLDRYFIERSLSNLKDKGTMAMMVAPGVLLNKGNREWRVELMKQGQFMGAVRLPNKSFSHSGTSVNPDILMFRRYPESVRKRLEQLDEEGLKRAGFFDESWAEGSYYDDHPEHRLGEAGTGNWGRETTEGDLSARDMDRAVQVFEPAKPMTQGDAARLERMTTDPAEKKAADSLKLSKGEADAVAAKTLVPGMTKTVDGKLYMLNANHRWERVKGADDEAAEKLEDIRALSATIKEIRAAMRRDEPVDEMQRQARELMEAYREKYGVAHDADPAVEKVVKATPKMAGVYEALTVGVDDAIMTNRNLYDKEIQIQDGHNPAVSALYQLQQNMRGGEEETIRRFFPNDADALIAAMHEHDDIFLTADGEWQLREDFIAGNAYDKIDALEAAVEREELKGDPDRSKIAKWEHGAEQLRDAVGWVTIEDPEVFPQMTWIPEDILQQFAVADDGLGISAGYSWDTGDKNVPQRDEDGTWDESQMGFANFARFLNGHKQRGHTDTEAYERVVMEKWRAWISSNDEVRERLEELYNRAYNTELGVPTKTYAVELDGWVDADEGGKTLQAHQWQSIHHLYREGKGISALGTGFGKTLSALGLMALLRQEGKVKRPFLQVPNNKVKDWKRIIGQVLPGWNVGAVDPEDDGYASQEKRYKMYQDIANSDVDIVILPESAASEIQLNEELDTQLIDEAMYHLVPEEGRSPRKVQEQREKLREKLTGSRRNVTMTFEDFGCDAVFVDEAHNYKNLFQSSLGRELGMNDGRRSDRALALWKKNEYIRRNNDDKNVFFLTATPLTNSPLEYYNMLQHIAPDALDGLQVSNINEFIKNFADIENGVKFDPMSGKAKEGRILKGFKNLRALQDVFFKYTDLQNEPEKIGLKKPDSANKPNVLERDNDQMSEVQAIAKEVEQYRDMSPDEREQTGHNFLTFYSRLRTASLDLELYDPQRYKGWKNPKIERLAENAKRTYDERGGGQAVFCDRVMSGDASFNMHEKIKARLVAQGFKESEIVTVNGVTKSGGKQSDAALEKQVSKAIEGYNSGKYKVIIGTTQTLGEGVGLQKNSSSLHHLDIPYRPSDFIQRNGRVDRQGNKQSEVTLHTYMSAGTIDNYSVGLVDGKANWIDQLLKTKSNVFTNPDAEGFDMDDVMISLTEEFGDSAGADERKRLKAERAEQAARELHREKATKGLAQLATMRAALRKTTVEKGSKQYQARLQKIRNLEMSLQGNPEFNYPELLGDDPPDFLVDPKIGHAYKVGDLVVQDRGVFKIARIDHAKKRYTAQPVLAASTTGVDVSVMESTHKTGSYWSPRDNGRHMPSYSEADLPRLKALVDYSEFESRDDDFKRDYYRDMLASVSWGNDDERERRAKQSAVSNYGWASGAKIPVYTLTSEGKLSVSERNPRSYQAGVLNSSKEQVLNPYDPEERSQITAKLEAGEVDHVEGSNHPPEIQAQVDKHRLAAIESNIGAEGMAALKRDESDEWQPFPAEIDTNGMARFYVNDHPDYETDYRGGQGYVYRRKQRAQKSIRYLVRL